MVDITFIVEHDCDPNDIPVEALLDGMAQRWQRLKNADTDVAKEAFGICDTYEIDSELIKIT